MKKGILIVSVLIICAVVAVIIVPFLTVAENINTSVSDIAEYVHTVSHVIDEKDEVNVSVSHTAEKYNEMTYRLSVLVHRDVSLETPDEKPSSKYGIENMSLTVKLDDSEKVLYVSSSEGCDVTFDLNNVFITSQTDRIEVDIIVMGDYGRSHEALVKYDLIGKGFNYLSRFENLETSLTLDASYENADSSDKSEDIIDLSSYPDGKEVSIFKDNTFDCDYSGYKEIGHNFENLRRSVMIPEDWSFYRFYKDYDWIENQLTGTPIYDGPLPVKIDPYDDSTLFANEPLTKATFFLAEYTWRDVEETLSDYTHFTGLLTKYDYEHYVDKQGRSMKVYFLDGLPRLAVYDDFFNLCIVFNLDSEEQIPTVVNMLNSVEVTLSNQAEHALALAEKLGYTIIPPEE